MQNFKESARDRGQFMLMPPSVDEMVEQSDRVRLLDEIMSRLDYRKLESSYPGGGCPAYPPDVMAKILTFAYSMGQRSSRKIAALLRVDLRYIWLSNGQKPDFRTLARFRKEKCEYLEELFVQSVQLCMESGLVLLENVAVDGTKIEAGCGSKSIWGEKRIERERERIARIIKEAEDVDSREDQEYGESDPTTLPDALKDAESRKAAVDDAFRRLEESGKKAISKTDPESCQMKTRHGIKMSYNVQAAVDSERQVVVGMFVSQDENDRDQMGEVLEKISENTGCKSDLIVADRGYDSPSNLEALNEHEQAAAIWTQKLPKQCKQPQEFRYDPDLDVYVCPAGRQLVFKGMTSKGKTDYRMYVCQSCKGCEHRAECGCLKRNKRLDVNEAGPLRKRMDEFLKTEAAKDALKQRKEIVEPVFGQIKQNRLFRRFCLMGLIGARAECALIFLAHNLFKIGIPVAA